MYVVKTTDALVLFFKQRNLQNKTQQSKFKIKGREVVLQAERKKQAKHSKIFTPFVHGNHLRFKLMAKTARGVCLGQWFGKQLRTRKIITATH